MKTDAKNSHLNYVIVTFCKRQIGVIGEHRHPMLVTKSQHMPAKYAFPATCTLLKTSMWPSLCRVTCTDPVSNPSLELQIHLLSMPTVPSGHLSHSNHRSEPFPISRTPQPRLWLADLCQVLRWNPRARSGNPPFCCHSFRVEIKQRRKNRQT